MAIAAERYGTLDVAATVRAWFSFLVDVLCGKDASKAEKVIARYKVIAAVGGTLLGFLIAGKPHAPHVVFVVEC